MDAISSCSTYLYPVKQWPTFWCAILLSAALSTAGCGEGQPSGKVVAGDSLAGPVTDAQLIADLNGRIAQNPQDRDALLQRAAIYQSLGRPANALADWDRAAALQPLSSEERLDYAAVRLALGQHADALKAYTEALKDVPDRSLFYNARGTVLMAQGQYEAATKALDTALRHNARFADAWHNRGAAFYELGKEKDAEYHFQKALQLDPDHSRALSGLGYLYLNIRHDTVGADWYFQQAVAKDRLNPEAWQALGTISFSAGRMAAALSNFDAAIRADSSYADAWANRGLTLARLDRTQEAEDSYNMAVLLQPALGNAWAMRGLLRCMRGAHQEGCADLLHAKSMGVPGVQAQIDKYCL